MSRELLNTVNVQKLNCFDVSRIGEEGGERSCSISCSISRRSRVVSTKLLGLGKSLRSWRSRCIEPNLVIPCSKQSSTALLNGAENLLPLLFEKGVQLL